ncbi:MAG: hypothetical protein AB1806_13915 [Acidobacteriota bacterium]
MRAFIDEVIVPILVEEFLREYEAGLVGTAVDEAQFEPRVSEREHSRNDRRVGTFPCGIGL